jgi:hypothetical protein
MRFDSFTDVLGGVVLVAALTTVVTSRYTAGQITAAANGMGNLIAASLGKGSIRR